MENIIKQGLTLLHRLAQIRFQVCKLESYDKLGTFGDIKLGLRNAFITG